ncbi:hypothetical protein D3C75_955610 [compost metagenome]
MRPDIRGCIPPLRIMDVLHHRSISLPLCQQSYHVNLPGPPAILAAADAIPDAGRPQPLRITAVEGQLGKAGAFMQQHPGFAQVCARIQSARLAPGPVLEQPEHPSFACLNIVHIEIVVAYSSGIQHSRNAGMKRDTSEPFLRQIRLIPGLPFIPADP